MKEWKDTEIGLLPSNWDILTLGQCNSYKNKNINPSNFPEELFDYYSIPAYQNGQVPESTLGKEIQSNKLILETDSVVFGKLNPRVEKVWRVGSHSKHRKIGSTEWITIKPKDFIDFDFIYFMEWSDYVMPIAKTLVTGSTPSRQRVSPPAFYKIKIPVPPLPEQRKIAYVLSTIQKAIEQQDKLIKTTTELKKALMQKLFTEGLFGDHKIKTDFGYSPESWKIQPFENTGDVVYGIQAAVAKNLKPIGNKILTNKNITLDGRIDLEKLNYFELSTKRHFQTILRKGDLLFNWRSGSKEHVGKTALFDLEDGEYTHSSFILRIRVNEKHNSIFLYYYLNFLRESGYYQKVQTYSINAKFNKSAINAMPIALPEKSEQIEIAKILTTIDKKLDNLYQKKKVTQDLFKTMLHELMTGQRRVDEIDFEDEKEELLMAAESEIKYNKYLCR